MIALIRVAQKVTTNKKYKDEYFSLRHILQFIISIIFNAPITVEKYSEVMRRICILRREIGEKMPWKQQNA